MSLVEKVVPSSAKYTMSHPGSAQNRCAAAVTRRRAAFVKTALTVRTSTVTPLAPLIGHTAVFFDAGSDLAQQQSDIQSPSRTQYGPWSGLQSQAVFPSEVPVQPLR